MKGLKVKPVSMNNSSQLLHLSGTYYRFDGNAVVEFIPGAEDGDTEVNDLSNLIGQAGALIFSDPKGGLWYIEKNKPIQRLSDTVSLGNFTMVGKLRGN